MQRFKQIKKSVYAFFGRQNTSPNSPNPTPHTSAQPHESRGSSASSNDSDQPILNTSFNCSFGSKQTGMITFFTHCPLEMTSPGLYAAGSAGEIQITKKDNTIKVWFPSGNVLTLTVDEKKNIFSATFNQHEITVTNNECLIDTGRGGITQIKVHFTNNGQFRITNATTKEPLMTIDKNFTPDSATLPSKAASPSPLRALCGNI